MNTSLRSSLSPLNESNLKHVVGGASLQIKLPNGTIVVIEIPKEGLAVQL